MGWHKFGKTVDGQLCQFFGTVEDSEFEILTMAGLPKGWVAWHEGADTATLKLRPFVLDPTAPADIISGNQYADFKAELLAHIDFDLEDQPDCEAELGEIARTELEQARLWRPETPIYLLPEGILPD